LSTMITAANIRAQLLSKRPDEGPHTIEPVQPRTVLSPAPTASPKRVQLPKRLMILEPSRPLSAINDDPVFETLYAAKILAVSPELMKKWRQRNQGPDFIQYESNGPVRYALSALRDYQERRTVALSKGFRRRGR
jgi:hypothetical protein